MALQSLKKKIQNLIFYMPQFFEFRFENKMYSDLFAKIFERNPEL